MNSIAMRPLKLLSMVELPDRVLDVFREKFTVIPGTLDDAAAVEPYALLVSIRPYLLDRSAIEDLPDSVRAIATYSVGYDHIDLPAAKERNIAVFNTPGVLGDAVADAAMLLILGAARRVTESVSLLREGRWSGWSPRQLIGVGLAGKNLGIFGMGDIGRRVAKRARAFGMDIAYHNRQPVPGESARYFSDPRELVGNSDVLLLSCPSTPQTRRFISAETIALAKRNMILVNIGRGDLVEDSALIAALKDGRILAAGLDVFDNEPDINPDYLHLTNAFLLPHVGSSTWDARLAMGQILVDALEAHLAGRPVSNRIA